MRPVHFDMEICLNRADVPGTRLPMSMRVRVGCRSLQHKPRVKIKNLKAMNFCNNPYIIEEVNLHSIHWSAWSSAYRFHSGWISVFGKPHFHFFGRHRFANASALCSNMAKIYCVRKVSPRHIATFFPLWRENVVSFWSRTDRAAAEWRKVNRQGLRGISDRRPSFAVVRRQEAANDGVFTLMIISLLAVDHDQLWPMKC